MDVSLSCYQNLVMSFHKFVIPISYKKAADTEAAMGQRGSARIRIEAFNTLRVLVAKVM